MSLARLAARTVIGGLFIGHGTQKLFGWFDGPGPAGTAGMMENLQLRPAKLHATLAGATEAVCGGMLVAGLETPLAAAGLTGVMTTAIRKVHLPNGPWAANGGWEYNAVLIAAVTALAETGPGVLSLDRLRGKERKGIGWALFSLGLGAGAAMLTMAAGERGAPLALPPAPTDPTGDAVLTDPTGDAVLTDPTGDAVLTDPTGDAVAGDPATASGTDPGIAGDPTTAGS